VLQELAHGLPQRVLAEKDHLLEAFFLQTAMKPLQVCIQIR